MNEIIKIEKLNFKYQEKEIFKNLNITIPKNQFTIILGANASGKTTLAQILKQKIPNAALISSKRPPKNTVLEQLTVAKEKLEPQAKNITKILNIEKLLKKDPKTLNQNQQVLIAIASTLITNPKTLIIDETLNKLDSPQKEKIINQLTQKTKEKKLTVIYLTTNTNDSIYSDQIIILSKKTAITDTKENIYKNEKLLTQANLELPFIIELSKKLQFYNLINKEYQNEKELVEQLWK